MYSSTICNTQTWRQSKCPLTDEWIKMWHVCVCVCVCVCARMHAMEYYSDIKKNEIMPFSATWMDLEIIKIGEVRKRKTITTGYHLYVESKIQHKHMYKTKIDSQIEQTCGCWGGYREKNWEFGISRWKLLYTRWLNNKTYCIEQGTIVNTRW